MKQDPAAEKAMGWILEMYAFSIASAVKPGAPVAYELHPEMMVQPPFDQTLQARTCPRTPTLVLTMVLPAQSEQGPAECTVKPTQLGAAALQLGPAGAHLPRILTTVLPADSGQGPAGCTVKPTSSHAEMMVQPRFEQALQARTRPAP